MEPAKEEILDAFLKSEKKHLLITGRRACGKTTLFNEIAQELPGNDGAIRGITTYTIPHKSPSRLINSNDGEISLFATLDTIAAGNVIFKTILDST